MNKTPLVTIIVPSFNQGHFIRETIESILRQDYRPIEVLVMDGGSTDQTVSVLESYNASPELKWWSEPDNGVVDAFNKGLERATGDIIGVQSSDDIYLPGAISAAVEAMSANPDFALVYGDVDYIDENSTVTGRDVLTAFDFKHYLGRFTYIPQPGAFFRAQLVKEIGGWRGEVSYTADADFWMRIAVGHKVAKLDRVMGRYRYHADQRDAQKAKIARDWEKMIRDLLAANHLDRQTRHFAEMGIYLAKHRYTLESNWKMRTLYLYQAAASNPGAIFHPCFPKQELLVGRKPIWQALSRIKRRLGFRPRTSEIL